MSINNFNFPSVRNVSVHTFKMSNIKIQTMTAPSGGVFYIDYIYRHTHSIDEWKNMFFNGKRSCFDWTLEEHSADNYVLLTPDGLVVAWARPSTSLSYEVIFYPYGETRYGGVEEVKGWAKMRATEYGFKILDEKYRVLT